MTDTPNTPNDKALATLPLPKGERAGERGSPKRIAPRLFIAATLSLLTPTGLAQDLVHKAAPQAQPIIITGATVHTAGGPTYENGTIHFDEGRITYVGPESRAPRPRPDTRRIDATGMHVAPGFFAADTRIGLVEVNAVRATRDFNEVGGITPEVRANSAINPDTTLLPVARSGGILLAGVFPSGGRVPGRVNVVRLDGWTTEDMTVDAGGPQGTAGLILDWPSMRPNTAWWNDTPASEQQRNIDNAVKAIDQVWDDAEAYMNAREADDTHPQDIRFDAMIPVIEGESPLIIAANDYDQIVTSVTWAKSRGYDVIINGGQDADLAADLLLEHDVPVIISGTHVFPKRADQPHDHAYTLPKRLYESGIDFALGTADRDGNVRNLPFEAGMAARFGLPKSEALRAVTLAPAQIFGVDEDYGSLEEGKSATLIISTHDPLEVRSYVLHAFIDGRGIDLTNKQRALADKYREKYRQLGLINE
ncbi:MAG: amidohydrolase family protein [Planctomycetota bacterium]